MSFCSPSSATRRTGTTNVPEVKATTDRVRLDLFVAMVAGCLVGWMLGGVLIWIMVLAMGGVPGD